jgi:hypothetical protein
MKQSNLIVQVCLMKTLQLLVVTVITVKAKIKFSQDHKTLGNLVVTILALEILVD